MVAKHVRIGRRSTNCRRLTRERISATCRSLGGVFCAMTTAWTLYPNLFMACRRAHMSARAPLSGGQGRSGITCKTFIGVTHRAALASASNPAQPSGRVSCQLIFTRELLGNVAHLHFRAAAQGERRSNHAKHQRREIAPGQ